MNKIIAMFVLITGLAACAKQEVGLNTGWNSFYHIEGEDTVSYMHFPNTFTSDGNGTNDIYLIITSNISNENFEFRVFDKKGVNVFTSNNQQIGWDGTNKGMKAPSSIFYYKIYAKDSTGYEYKADGSLYLLR
ncbi:MAG TPA: gliding motility-associated C-terminal domain-containing protein [Flavobacteriales bacterium]|nr:gliding motility-associated C-terminal domain-containing protein [Flavobacteriales bacterium]